MTRRGRILAAAGAVCLLAVRLPADADRLSRRERERLAADARTFFDQQDYASARAHWERALTAGASRRESREWLPWVGRAWEAQEHWPEALAVYETALKGDPRQVDRMVDVARLQDLTGQPDRALAHYEAARRRDPARRDVVLAMARLHARADRPETARALAAAAVESDPGDLSAQELLAGIEESLGLWESAARRFERLVDRRPGADGYLALGRLWARQDAFDQADLAFARAEKAGAVPGEALFERAVLAWRRGERARAVLFLEEAERRPPLYFPAQFLAAVLDDEAGRFMTARVRLMETPPPDDACVRWTAVMEAVSVPPPRRTPR